MKAYISIFGIFVVFAFVAASSVSADPGGTPAAHEGLYEGNFGQYVSENAPINEHVSNAGGNSGEKENKAGGQPAAHEGLYEGNFGQYVSENAPINEHVSNAGGNKDD